MEDVFSTWLAELAVNYNVEPTETTRVRMPRRSHAAIASITPRDMITESAESGQSPNFVSLDGEPFMCMSITDAMDAPLRALVRVDVSAFLSCTTDLVAAGMVPPITEALHPAGIGALFATTSSCEAPMEWVVGAARASKKEEIVANPDTWIQNAMAVAGAANIHESLWEFVRRAGVYRFPQSSCSSITTPAPASERGGGCLSTCGSSKAVQGGGFHGAHGILRRPLRALLELVVLFVEEFVAESALPPESRRAVVSLHNGPGALLGAVQVLCAAYVASAMLNATRKDVRTTRRTGVASLTARGARLRPGTHDVLGAAAVLATAAEVLSDEENDVNDLHARSPLWMRDGSFTTDDVAWRVVRCTRTGRRYQLCAKRGGYAPVDDDDAAAAESDTLSNSSNSGIVIDAGTGVVTFLHDEDGERARQDVTQSYAEMLHAMHTATRRHRDRYLRLHLLRLDGATPSMPLVEDDASIAAGVRRLPRINFLRLRRRKPSAPLAVDAEGRLVKRRVGRPRGQGPHQLARAAAAAAAANLATFECADGDDDAALAGPQDKRRRRKPHTAKSNNKSKSNSRSKSVQKQLIDVAEDEAFGQDEQDDKSGQGQENFSSFPQTTIITPPMIVATLMQAAVKTTTHDRKRRRPSQWRVLETAADNEDDSEELECDSDWGDECTGVGALSAMKTASQIDLDALGVLGAIELELD